MIVIELTCVLKPLQNPFGPKVLPMSSVRCLTLSPGWTFNQWRAQGDDLGTFLIDFVSGLPWQCASINARESL